MPRPRLLLPIAVVWVVSIAIVYHFGPASEPFPPGNLPGLLFDVALLALLAAAADGAGRTALRCLRLPGMAGIEGGVYAMGLGLGALAMAVFGLAAAGLLYRPVVAALVGAALLSKIVGKPAEAPRSPFPAAAWRRSDIGFVAAIVVPAFATLGAALAPPEFYDALIYHLAVPDLYLRSHAMVPVEGNYYASFPANMGMLYVIGLALGGGSLAQAIHWLCGAMAAAALFAVARRHTDRATAMIACLLFAMTPGVMLASTYAIADLGVTLFAVLCFGAVLEHWREGDRRWLVAAGVFAGLAAGTKYTAILVVCLPAAAAIILRPGAAAGGPRAPRRVVDVALFGAVAFLLLSPWLARNAVFTGNPLAPYLSAAGAAHSPDIAEEMARRLPQGAGPADLALHVLAAPWNVTMRRLGAAGYLGPAFLMLLPFLPFQRDLPRILRPLAILSAAGFAAWALTTQVTRYLMPVLPILAWLAAMAARRVPRLVAVPAVGWSILYGLFLFLFLGQTTGQYRVVTGAETRDEYLSRRVSYYAAAMKLGEAPGNAKVLFVGEGRTFYCPREYVASTPFDRPAIETYAARAGGGDEPSLVRAMRADGITHLLVSGPELERTRGVAAGALMRRYFPAGSPVLLADLNGVRLYELPR